MSIAEILVVYLEISAMKIKFNIHGWHVPHGLFEPTTDVGTASALWIV